MTVFVIFFGGAGVAAPLVTSLDERVDAVTFDSAVLGKNKEFCVILPEAYTSSKSDWPVLFLLHGRGRHNRTLVDDPESLAHLKTSGFVIVLPDGDDGWWIDSPAIPASRYETYLEEVIGLASSMYRLSDAQEKRALTGWSMGGYGCMRFAQRHADKFKAVSPIIGLLDYPKDPSAFPPGRSYPVREQFGTDDSLWPDYNPINGVEALRGMDVQIITGADAFDRTMNENFHHKLTSLGIEHKWILYDRKAGFDVSHSLEMVRNSLPAVISFVEKSFSGTEPEPDTGHVLLREGVSGYRHVAAELREESEGGDRKLGVGHDEMLVGVCETGIGRLRAALSFDLSMIPEGAVITDVRLTLAPKRFTLAAGSPVGIAEIGLFALAHETDMVESEVCWNRPAAGAAWSGGAFDPDSPLVTVPGYETPDLTPVEFSTTAALIAAVESALAKESKSLELIVSSPQTEPLSDGRHFIGFWSDDAADLNNRPLLSIAFTLPAGPEGDLNGDGFVGAADLDLIRANWGSAVTPGDLSHGDANGDGVIDSADLDIVRETWGEGIPPVEVPEPKGFSLGLGGLFAFLAARRKWREHEGVKYPRPSWSEFSFSGYRALPSTSGRPTR